MSTTETWVRKRAAFFASNPKCTVCGGSFDHYSRTMVCRHCQNIKYRETQRAKQPGYNKTYRRKNKKRIAAYQAKYYLANKETISRRKKYQYQEKKRSE